jgi:hypothetical protein
MFTLKGLGLICAALSGTMALAALKAHEYGYTALYIGTALVGMAIYFYRYSTGD